MTITHHLSPSGSPRAILYDKDGRLCILRLATLNGESCLVVDTSPAGLILTREMAGEMGRVMVAFEATGELTTTERETAT